MFYLPLQVAFEKHQKYFSVLPDLWVKLKHQEIFFYFFYFLIKSLKSGKENFKDLFLQFLSTNFMEVKIISENVYS